ncbi:MAG: transposase [Cyanobacteria bacterium]|nr:transposase [Cyanobacteriota bacterium]
MSRIIAANTKQLCLVPSEPGCLLPTGHLVRFFNQIVEKELDVSKLIEKRVKAGKHGRPSYDPVMLLKIVLYGYMVGLHSSRKIAKACVERIDFRFLTGGLTPSFSTITKFRSEQVETLAELFPQSISIALDDELIEMKDVAFDGTKILANASKRKAMSYERMCQKVQQLHGEIEGLKIERRTASARRREEIERDLQFKRDRFANIQEQRFALEDQHSEQNGELPKEKDQRNFTDPESRIMKKGAGFEQCYNAQAAVDKSKQIIVAAYVTQAGNDKQQLEPLVDLTVAGVGVLPDRGLADAGYFSEAVAQSLKQRYETTEWLISPGRVAHGSNSAAPPRGRTPQNISVADLMRRKLSTKAGKTAYAQRKAIVEPIFGQIKEANLEFRRFSFRGLIKVHSEWLLVCAAHNLLKIVRHRRRDYNVKSIVSEFRAA